MNNSQEKRMNEVATELAKDIKTGEDLSAFSAQLRKIIVEAALGAEMEKSSGLRPTFV